MSDSISSGFSSSGEHVEGSSDSFMNIFKNASILNFFLIFLLAITLLSPLISSLLTFDGSSSFVKPEFMSLFILKIALIGGPLFVNFYSLKNFRVDFLKASVIASIIVSSLFISFNVFTLFFSSWTGSSLIYFDNLLLFLVFNFIFLAVSSLVSIVVLVFGLLTLKSIQSYDPPVRV